VLSTAFTGGCSPISTHFSIRFSTSPLSAVSTAATVLAHVAAAVLRKQSKGRVEVRQRTHGLAALRRASVVEVSETRQHVMLDQPLGFIAALRMLLDGWMRNKSAEGSRYVEMITYLTQQRKNRMPAKQRRFAARVVP
jgi:hypothetical protein